MMEITRLRKAFLVFWSAVLLVGLIAQYSAGSTRLVGWFFVVFVWAFLLVTIWLALGDLPPEETLEGL